MVKTIGAFFSLYLATVVLMLGGGLFNTYLALRLTSISVSEVWVGALIAIYYLGLVFGARSGHKLIIQVGHIRAYAASAAMVTVAVLAQVLVDNLWIWLLFRFVAGMAMVTQFMVIESWLNEQTENHMRGSVFAIYMLVSGLGTVLGQLALTLFSSLEYEPLVFVAICFVLSLVPVAVTRRMHPALQIPVPIAIKYYVARVPLSMTVLFIAGMITGAFYGLAPVYATMQSMSSDQVAIYLAASVAAGLISQWPLGWLADRVSRVRLIQINAVLLMSLAVPLWGWWSFPYWAMVTFSCAFGILQFTLYPLGAAFANDNVEPERRVGLSAILYMVYGLGACVGPLMVGILMRELDTSMYFIFVSCCAAVLVLFVRPKKVTGDNLSEDAPTHFVAMSDSLPSSSVIAVLDPRVDMECDVSAEPVEPLTGDEDDDGANREQDAQAVNQR